MVLNNSNNRLHENDYLEDAGSSELKKVKNNIKKWLLIIKCNICFNIDKYIDAKILGIIKNRERI